jgi:hypothetical protein
MPAAALDDKKNSVLSTLPWDALVNHDFTTYTTPQLIEIASEIEKKNEFLQLETGIFESFLARSINSGGNGTSGKANGNEDDKATTNPDGSVRISLPNEEATANQGTTQPTRVKKKKGDKSKPTADVIVYLSSEQKVEIATRELEELKEEVERRKSEWGKSVDNLRAEMEEIETGLTEIKKATYEFKRDIVQSALSERTGKVVAEKVIRYFEDKMRSRDTTLEKIRLKNSTLKTQKNKLMLQLKQKEEMGEVLHAIDFDQLKIENHQYMAKIEERNGELLKLKMAAGNIVQVLNVYKKKLSKLETEAVHLRTELSDRKQLLEKLKIEAKIVKKDIDKAYRIHKNLVVAGKEFQVPNVMEYVMLKVIYIRVLLSIVLHLILHF